MFQSIQIKGNQTVPFDIHPDPHRCQHKWLGTATLHLGPTIYYPTCIFFEINESDIIFTLPGNSSTFYCFPREALLEYLTESAPHKMVLSFFPSSNEQDDALSDHHVMLSNVSHELSRAFKQVVYAYEMKCQNMMILFKRHEEQITHHKSEIAMLPETTYSSQSEKIHQDDSSTSSYDDVLYEKEKKKVKQDHHRSGGSVTNKKCLYCGSKSTPMWRRGPQGAGTLCNACGVKWKHGKILNGNDPKPEKKRKRSNSNNSGKRKSSSSSSSSVHHEDEGQQRFPSETSSTSDSPLESSPNTSPSELQKAVYHMTYLMDFDGNEMLEDAVEAAALLTLLKRS